MPRSLSVGICAHNEEETIGTLMDQLMEEDLPFKEVIVVVAGNDSTADIVRDRMDIHEEIVLVEEESREGQSNAQNKILSRATGDDLLMLDGDGTIEPGNLETLYDSYKPGRIVAGREVPVTENSFLGSIIDVHGTTHHHLCERSPRFTTQIGIIPSDLIDRFPDVVLDDAYIEHRAREEGLDIVYEPEAVKYHHLPHTLRFFFHQQKKNWAGRFQLQEKGYRHSKPQHMLLKTYLEQVKKHSSRHLPSLAALGIVEISAYTAALYRKFTGKFPVKWWRPESSEA